MTLGAVVHDPGEPVGPLTKAEKRKLSEAEQVIDKGWRTFMEVGNALIAINTGRLFRATHESFRSYVQDRWDWPVSRAYQQMQAARTVQYLEQVQGVDSVPKNELVARTLGALLREGNEELLVEAWTRAVQEANGEPPTALQTRAAVRAVRYLHSDYFKTEVKDKTGAGLVLLAPPDALLRDAQSVIRAALRNTERVVLPDPQGMDYLELRWRRKVRADITALVARLEELGKTLDEADE